jgi:hypothetical protein
MLKMMVLGTLKAFATVFAIVVGCLFGIGLVEGVIGLLR